MVNKLLAAAVNHKTKGEARSLARSSQLSGNRLISLDGKLSAPGWSVQHLDFYVRNNQRGNWPGTSGFAGSESAVWDGTGSPQGFGLFCLSGLVRGVWSGAKRVLCLEHNTGGHLLNDTG